MRNTEQTILFGKYRICRLLGEGASGQVYLAEHMKLKTYRAIKCISKSHPLQSQFRLEANLLRNLNHPSIPIVYDLEEDHEFLYIIEEYVEGESLQEYLLYHDSISQEYIMQLGIRLCDVFIYLHSRKPHPVCYKDLKPEHIIVCGNSVKIVDFGIASYITRRGRNFQNLQGAVELQQEYELPLGTVGYAPPEQYTGEELTPAADLYALGRVFMQLEMRVEKCSKNLNRIIQKAADERVGRRYASAEELKQALVQEMNRICPGQSGNTHLCYHIAAAGARSGIGTTHIALAVTSYLNRQGFPCIYRSRSQEDVVELLLRSHQVTEEKPGIYGNGYFRGILKMSGEKEEVPEDLAVSSIVSDYGSNLTDCMAEEADVTILVIGGSSWELECSLEALKQTEHVRNLLVICNHNHRRICRKYADLLDRRVYCFPFDMDPFLPTGEKQRLFGRMLRKKK